MYVSCIKLHKSAQTCTAASPRRPRPHGVRVDMQVVGASATERGPCRVEASALLTSSLSVLVVFLIKFTFLFSIPVIWLVRLLAFLGSSLYFMILLRGTQHWELPLYGPQVLISKLSLSIIKCSWVNAASSVLAKRALLSSLMF